MNNQEFFTSTMNQSLGRYREKVVTMIGLPEDEKQRMVLAYSPVESSVYGFLGNGGIEAMADALLTIPATSWEQFYLGYVDWLRSLSECRIPTGKLEENARGAMLLALKYHIDDLQGLKARAASV